MKKIEAPICDSCGASNGWYHDEQWGLRLCYNCIYDAASFMSQSGLLESNPLCELLFDGVWRTTDSTYEVWCCSRHEHKASSQHWISRLVK